MMKNCQLQHYNKLDTKCSSQTGWHVSKSCIVAWLAMKRWSEDNVGTSLVFPALAGIQVISLITPLNV